MIILPPKSKTSWSFATLFTMSFTSWFATQFAVCPNVRIYITHCIKADTHVQYLAKTKSCTGLYCYSPISLLINTHMRHMPHTCWAVLCQTFVLFDVWKIPTFFKNDEYRARIAQLRMSAPLHTTCHLPNIYQMPHICSHLHMRACMFNSFLWTRLNASHVTYRSYVVRIIL